MGCPTFPCSDVGLPAASLKTTPPLPPTHNVQTSIDNAGSIPLLGQPLRSGSGLPWLLPNGLQASNALSVLRLSFSTPPRALPHLPALSCPLASDGQTVACSGSTRRDNSARQALPKEQRASQLGTPERTRSGGAPRVLSPARNKTQARDTGMPPALGANCGQILAQSLARAHRRRSSPMSSSTRAFLL